MIRITKKRRLKKILKNLTLIIFLSRRKKRLLSTRECLAIPSTLPVRNYARLIKKIKDKVPEACVAVSYTKSDMKILDSFFGQLETDNLKLGKDIYDFKGDEWGIDGLVYLLAASDVTVAPSTALYT